MITSFARGHKIYFKDGKWFYSDNNETFKDDRACKKCGCYPTIDGHDACLGSLKEVKNACCGHGRKEHRYIERSH